MVKKFEFQGIPLKEIENMPMDKLFQLFSERDRRSLTGGITDGKRKTHLRDLNILPYMTGVQIVVFSGKEFVPVNIVPEMIGHYLGEYVISNKRVSHGAPGVGSSRSSLYVPLK